MIENYTNYETKKKNFLKRFFSKSRYFILGALAFFLLYFFWTKFGYILKGQGIIEGKAVTITQRQVVNNLEISAEIKPHITKTYTAFAFSTVENVPVKAGQYVKKGDLLIQLSSDDLNRALKIAESAYRSAKDRLNTAQTDYESTKLLYLKNLESQNKVLSSKQKYEKYLNEDFPKVKQAYEDAVNNIAELSISATITGFVTEVNKFKGDLVPKNDPLITVSQLTGLYARFYISQFYLGKFKSGTKVNFYANYANTKTATPIATGTVTNVAAFIADKGILVEVSFKPAKKADARKYLNQKVKAAIELEKTTAKVAALPLSAFYVDPSGYYVYVIQQGTLKRQNVQIGLIGTYYAQIKSGLTITDKIAAYPNLYIQEGKAFREK